MISRRDVVKLGAAGLIAPALGATFVPDLSAVQEAIDDVPMFRGNAARTGEMPGPAPGPDKPMIVKWRFAINGGVSSSPIAVNGTVFVASAESSDEGEYSFHSTLYAIDSISGEERWRFPTQGLIASTPAVADDTLFVGNSEDHKLYAIETSTGRQRWLFAPGGRVDSSPAVADGMVFVGCNDHNLYVIDASSGEERWRFDAGNRVGSSPAVTDNTVFVASDAGALYAIDASSGKERWRFDTGGVVSPSAAAVNGMVYIGSGQPFGNFQVHAIDASTGVELWRFPLKAVVWTSSPAVADGIVFIGSDGLEIYAVDAASGEERWRLSTDSYDDGVSPVVIDGTVITNWGGLGLVALDASTGTKQWSFKPDDWYPRSPAVVDGNIFVNSANGYLFAVCNLVPTVLTTDVTLRAAPSDGAVERGTAKAGHEIDHVGTREERNGQAWAEVTVGGVTGWIPLDAIDPATLPPEGEIEYVYVP
jgi:outer membrane protein assembly factor BamB